MPDELVVLVDDDEDLLRSLKKIMVRHGLRAITACNGREALDKMETLDGNINTVVVLDIKMPCMDGFRTLNNMNRCFPKAKVIIHSAHCAMQEIVESMLLDGAVDCLTKPCEPMQLLDSIQRAFDSFRAEMKTSKQLRRFAPETTVNDHTIQS